MDISIEFTPKTGLQISAHIRPAVLRVVMSAVVGLASLPWLTHLAQALGWLAI